LQHNCQSYQKDTYTVDVYRVFHLGDQNIIGSRVVYKAKLIFLSYNEGDFTYVQDKVNSVLEFSASPYKCKSISEKLIHYGYHQTSFNFQNLLTSLDFVIKTSTSKSNGFGMVAVTTQYYICTCI